MIEIMPWLLSLFTIGNIWLLGKKRRAGFMVGLAAQPLWLAFDFSVGAYGLMPLGLILGYLYIKGWRNWKDVP